MCAEVSFPLPVKSRYATVLSFKTRSESVPFGERLTRPVLAADATKNMGD